MFDFVRETKIISFLNRSLNRKRGRNRSRTRDRDLSIFRLAPSNLRVVFASGLSVIYFFAGVMSHTAWKNEDEMDGVPTV